ncbi:WD40-repeat-containing domain protein [Rhizoctonia solani]|nr:WD40-repeat-containing domain protein [Rhizoctonia solani]
MSDSQGKDPKRHRVRDSLKIGLGRLKHALKPSSHHSEASAASSASNIANPSPAPSIKDKPNESGAKNKAWAGLEVTLRTLGESAKLFSPLQATIGELASCLDVIEAAANNRDDYEELATELKATIEILSQYAADFDSEEGKNSVAHIIRSIQAQVVHISKQREQSNMKRLLESANDREDIIKCYRTIEMLFRQLQNEVTLRTWRIQMSLLRGMSPVEDARYDSKYSMLVKRRGCTPETREKVQESLQAWARDPTGAKIYWMNGMAGTGKTTIAYSLCSWLEDNLLLGASFFCSRILSSCRDLTQIVPTIAYQLANYSYAYRSALCTILEDDPDASSRNVTRQFDKLLKGPLSQMKDAMPEGVVIVIDALDECQDHYGVRLMLEVLLRLATTLPLKFFVTSRPEPSIYDKMSSPSGSSPSMLHLHDIEQSIVQEDIKKYLFEVLGSMSPSPSPDQIENLAKQAGKLFIYAATAARYILPDAAHVDSSARLRAMLQVNADSSGTGKHKKKYKELDMLYATILSAALNEDILEDEELLVMKNVLSTILCAREPLSARTVASLLGLTEQQVLSTLQPLRSVLHVSEGGESISALHASFPDYMFNLSRSGSFYCDIKAHNGQMAEWCFDVMDKELRFNICQLESSYVLDKDVPDLVDRVKRLITAALLYACRYWGQHIQLGISSTILHSRLLSFVSKKVLFWMEVLNLSGNISIGQSLILCAQNWSLANNGSGELQNHLSDARTFVTQFAGSACSQSTPHLYISALPFCLKFSTVYKNFSSCTQRLVEVGELAPLASWKTTSEAFDRDRIACGFEDSMIRVLHPHTGATMVGPFEGHTASVESIAFSSDGTFIVSGSADSTIIIWDALTSKLVSGPIKGHKGSVVSVAFSHNAARVISGSEDRTIRVWNTETGTIIAGPLQGHAEGLTSITVSPNGRYIASLSNDHMVLVWDLNSDNPSGRALGNDANWVNSIAFSHDGARLASGSYDTIRIWDPYAGVLLAEMLNRDYGGIRSIVFSPDGGRVATGCDDGTIRVWDIDTKIAVAGPFTTKVMRLSSIAFSPEGSRIVSGYRDNAICTWDAYVGGPVDPPKEHGELALLLAFSPDGGRFVNASDEGALFVREVDTGQLITGPPKAHDDAPISLSFSPDGTRVAAGFFEGIVYIINASSGETFLAPFEAHTGPIHSITFSPDGNRFITGSSDCTVKFWDAHTGDAMTETLQGHTDAILSVQFSPDGAFIATGSSDSTVGIWEASTGFKKELLTGHDSGVNSVAFSPDGALVASGSDDTTIKLWKFHEGNCNAKTLKGHTSELVSVYFSLDGTQIISRHGTGDILARPLEGLTDPIGRVAISSTHIATSSVDHYSEEYSIIRISKIAVGFEADSPLRGSWEFNDDGWITVDGKLLLWIPPDLHECVPYPHETLAIGLKGSLHIGWEGLALGDKWAECYVSE